MNDRVMFLDTTLRDGEQTAGVSFHLSEKVEIARALEALGVDVVEAGFAGASLGDAEAVRAVAKAVRGMTVCSLSRCVESDVNAAWDALREAARPRIHVFIATSPLHREFKLRMSREAVLEAAVRCVRMARAFTDDVEFSCEDATRTERDYLLQVYAAALSAGATVINVPDTVGYCTVPEFGELVSQVRALPGMDAALLSVHCHDDLGLATALSLEGVLRGARQVECTINGLGERAGNAPLEEIVMGLRTRRDWYGVSDGIETHGIHRISRMVAGLSGMDIPANKPVVGANAFVHQSGIHQHGVLNARATYEVMKPEDIGLSSGELLQDGMVLGKLSGRHALAERAVQLGYTLTDSELSQVFVRFKELADRKKDITDRDVMALLREQMLTTKGAYTLRSFQIFSGNRMTSTATVSLQRGADVTTRAACGEGPVEACFNAVDMITALPCKLESYRLRAVTEGQDALGEVTVRVRDGETVMLGKGLSTDVIEASCLSYVNAVNRVIAAREEKDA